MSLTKKAFLALCTMTFVSSASVLNAQDADETAEATENTQVEASDEALSDVGDMKTKDHVLGEDEAPLTIVEFASFTCPHCMDFEDEVMPKIKEEYIDTGKAKLIYREVYFDGAGLLAASLARCVPAEQYYPVVFTLYSQADTWLKSQDSVEGIIGELTKIGVMAGLPKNEIAKCLDDRESQEKMIENSAALMAENNVKGTPTIIVNGRTVENWQWDNLKPLLDEEYEKATK